MTLNDARGGDSSGVVAAVAVRDEMEKNVLWSQVGVKWIGQRQGG